MEHAVESGTFSLDPAGVQTGARPTRDEMDHGSANVPADLARLFRACLCSVARRLGTGPGGALEAILDHAIASWWVATPRADEHRLRERIAALEDACARCHDRFRLPR